MSKKPAGRFRIEMAADDSAAEVKIFGTIGGGGFEDGIDAKAFVNEVQAIPDDTPINLRINSGGGSIFEGGAMFAALMEHPAPITAFITGVAASQAAVLAMTGDTIKMAENSHFMIHNTRGGVFGTAEDVRSFLPLLENNDKIAARIFASRSKQTESEVSALMDAETWFTAAEAQAAGFVDEVVGQTKEPPHVTAKNFAPANYMANTFNEATDYLNTLAACFPTEPQQEEESTAPRNVSIPPPIIQHVDILPEHKGETMTTETPAAEAPAIDEKKRASEIFQLCQANNCFDQAQGFVDNPEMSVADVGLLILKSQAKPRALTPDDPGEPKEPEPTSPTLAYEDEYKAQAARYRKHNVTQEQYVAMRVNEQAGGFIDTNPQAISLTDMIAT